MTEHDETATADWAWFREEYEDLPPRLIFVRGVTPERIIQGFGADPAAARLLSADTAHEGEPVAYPWIRVGRVDEWAFAIDTSIQDALKRIAPDLSSGTDLAMVESNPKGMDFFNYLVDGTEVTSFEGLMADDRDGTDPDRFLAQMRQAGLEVDPLPDDDDSDAPDIMECLLALLTLALGIRLPRDMGLGPLLTVQVTERRPAHPDAS